jgi:hypothetical protein
MTSSRSDSPVVLNSVQPVADLLEIAKQIGRHPSFQTINSADQYATTTSSQNWKLFVIGVLAPDNDVSFHPTYRRPAAVPLAGMPPQLIKKKKVKLKGANTSGKIAGTMDAKKGTTFSRDDFRQAVVEEFTRLTGSSPSEDLLSILCAHAWLEMGASRGHRRADGTYARARLLNTNNNNIGGIHAGPGSSVKATEVKDIPTTGYTVGGKEQKQNVEYEDSHKEKHTLQPDGIPVDPTDPTVAVPNQKGTKLVIVDPKNPANKPFLDRYKKGGGYIDIDTKSGNAYLVAFRSHDTMEGGISSWLSLLVNRYPGVLKARTTEEYATELQNGEKTSSGQPRKYYDESIAPTSVGGNGHYVRSLDIQKESYDNEYPRSTGVAGRHAGAVTEAAGQSIMAYGSVTDPEDPLGPVFGRNIHADTDRMEQIQAQMQLLSSSIAFMRSIPPIVMLTNPQEFRRSHENLVDVGVKTRLGHVVHTGLEQPVKISASGVTAAQYAVNAGMNGGLTTANRIHSLSYRNLMSLVTLYKNNGSVYSSNDGTSSVIALPGSVFIIYDDHLYIGSFDSFSITDAADKPHNMSYSFAFTAKYDMHVDMGLDAQAAKSGIQASSM